MSLPTNKTSRKECPMARGLIDYFPDALAAVAHTSYIGNRQHNGPDAPLHWARGKSDDHADCVVRHLIDRGKIDSDGIRHSAKLAWRALALLQIEIEQDEKPVDAVKKSIETACCMSHAVTEDTKPASISSFPDYVPDKVERPIPSPVRPLFDELVSMGCPPKTAEQIVGGMSFSPLYSAPTMWAYVAGPMRGYTDFNFHAFDATRDYLLARGYAVISPADIDRAAEVNPNPYVAGSSHTYAMRDFWTLYFVAKYSGSIALLPKWYESVGASAEFFLARWLGLPVLNRVGDTYLGDPVADFVHGGVPYKD